MSYIWDPKILVTRFPREAEDIFSKAIYNYECQFSVIRSLLHVFALMREILEDISISEFLKISESDIFSLLLKGFGSARIR